MTEEPSFVKLSEEEACKEVLEVALPDAVARATEQPISQSSKDAQFMLVRLPEDVQLNLQIGH